MVHLHSGVLLAIKNNEILRQMDETRKYHPDQGNPALSLLGIYPEDAPTCNKDTCSTMFIAALFIKARSWKEPRYPSTEEGIQKMWYNYTMEYYSVIKHNDFTKLQANGRK